MLNTVQDVFDIAIRLMDAQNESSSSTILLIFMDVQVQHLAHILQHEPRFAVLLDGADLVAVVVENLDFIHVATSLLNMMSAVAVITS